MWQEKYEAVIGLEVHAQLKTKSKLFCADANAFGAEPNSQVSPVSLAHPGTLPVMNEKVTWLAVKLGLALDCDIVQENFFARKNYFYPDLPKGYQVSQHTAPICLGGGLALPNGNFVALNRIHMEEDAGKSLHDVYDDFTCIDLNRAGTPLLEIVTEPCIHSAEDAATYLTQLRKLVRWLHVCDGNMEEGSLRCDANISIRPAGEKKLGTRVEVKNLNSIRNVRKAIEIELERLVKLVENGEEIRQETRSFDADKNITFSLRSKEEAQDYRYFPEPDLPPFFIADSFIESVRADMPELPEALKKRFETEYNLSAYDAAQLTSDLSDVQFFNAVHASFPDAKMIANWMTGPLKVWANENDKPLEDLPVAPGTMAELMRLVKGGKTSFNIASTKLFKALLDKPSATPEALAAELGLLAEGDSDILMQWVDEALNAMPEKVAEYKKGKKNLLGLFAGEVKKRSKGKADMAAVTKILTDKLNA